jgi:hypothetical protein
VSGRSGPPEGWARSGVWLGPKNDSPWYHRRAEGERVEQNVRFLLHARPLPLAACASVSWLAVIHFAPTITTSVSRADRGAPRARLCAAIATCLFAATSRSTSVGGGQLESGSADERAHRLQVPARSSGTLARRRSLTPLEWPHPDLAIAGLRPISGELERDIQRGDRDDLEDAACFSPPADLSHMLQVVAVS